ncbi:MAG: GAF domain-containing protein [Cloacibacillus sp.]
MPRARAIFRPRKFWPSAFWLVFLAAGSVFSCAFGLFAFFTAVLVASFIGLNEFGRWSYKKNLIICAGVSVIVAIAGIFAWTEIVSLFVLFFAISAYLLHFRDRMARLMPELEGFAKRLAAARSSREAIENAWEHMQEMAPDAAIFIMLADIAGGLYIPEHFDAPERLLKRGGGTPWKVMAAGRAINVPRVVTSRDQPLDRDARSLVSVPIIAHGEKLGVLQLEAGTAGAFSEEDTATLSLAAMILAHELYMFEISGAGYDEPESLEEE